MATFPILQFGTSRFLQAHADLFVSEAMPRGEALGPIAVVQTTDNPASGRRIAALASGEGYPVRIRGFGRGVAVDRETRGTAIRKALQASRDWGEVRRLAVEEAEVILSNTGERGFDLDPRDDRGLAADAAHIPVSFPAKLAVLLYQRWRSRPETPISIAPCELISRNGDRLGAIVSKIAADWGLPGEFIRYLHESCRWANSLVDRIVSEAIEPVGAVAEPYALWAIERQPGLVLPCRHEAIVLTDDLDRYERLKLHILNLGHSILAEIWLGGTRAPEATVRDAMKDPVFRGPLEEVWSDEVLPVFAATGIGSEATAYVAEVRDRFANPFLAHRLADIAQNHAEKKRRRLVPIVADAERLGLAIPQSLLRRAIGSGA